VTEIEAFSRQTSAREIMHTVNTIKTNQHGQMTCPVCGGLKCLCRPRFFAGQLLTEEDLDAAQRYVIEKNKLHNRHLFGSGVVCGLAVRCNPCDGVVVIEPGYAIDSCGNDIVVCEAQQFDVIEYLETSFREEGNDCNGKIRRPPWIFDDRAKEYCLIISYNEEHTRPMTAMARDSGCSTRRCEPSRTSEVFRFDLVEEKPDQAEAPHDDFWSKAGECATAYTQQMKKFITEMVAASKKDNKQEIHSAYLELVLRTRDDLLKLYHQGPEVRCKLAAELDAIADSFPRSTEDPQYEKKATGALFRMLGLLIQLMLDCICDALLVPCAECGDEEGVALACLTVRNSKVEKICNIVRKQVLTGPALRYWLQPIYTQLDRLLDFICCEFDLGDYLDRIFGILRPEAAGDPMGIGSHATGQSHEPPDMATLSSSFTRAESAFKAASDFSAATLRSLRMSNLLLLTNPNVVTALDLYDLPADEAMTRLARMKVEAVEKRAATEAEAYDLRGLLRTTWIAPPGSRVEMITSPSGRVTSIRVLEGDQS
jgi:hypothetical protein